MPGNEVFIKKQGQSIILLPIEKSWNSLFESLNLFEKDLKLERNQPLDRQKREPLLK